MKRSQGYGYDRVREPIRSGMPSYQVLGLTVNISSIHRDAKNDGPVLKLCQRVLQLIAIVVMSHLSHITVSIFPLPNLHFLCWKKF